MELSQTRRIAAGPAAVWAALTDPTVLRRCIPGCFEIRLLSPSEAAATVRLTIGTLSATFRTRVKVEDTIEGRRLAITGEAHGGRAGIVRGRVLILLDGKFDGSLLTYEAKLELGGRIARFSARRFDATARNFSTEFLEHLLHEVEMPARLRAVASWPRMAVAR